MSRIDFRDGPCVFLCQHVRTFDQLRASTDVDSIGKSLKTTAPAKGAARVVVRLPRHPFRRQRFDWLIDIPWGTDPARSVRGDSAITLNWPSFCISPMRALENRWWLSAMRT